MRSKCVLLCLRSFCFISFISTFADNLVSMSFFWCNNVRLSALPVILDFMFMSKIDLPEN